MSLILTKDDGTTDVTYLPTSGNGLKQEFVNPSSSVTERENVLTDHQVRTGIGQSSRHSLSVRKVIQSTDGSKNGSIIASFTLTIPNIDTYTAAKMYDIVKQLQSSLKKACLDRLAASASVDGLDLNVTGPFNPA